MATKRRSEWEERPAKRAGGGGRRVDAPCVLKILAPEVLASAIIGKGGAVVKEIRESTGAKLAFTDHGEVYPGTDCRVLTASAASEPALIEVAAQVSQKLAEVVEAGRDQDANGLPTLKTVLPRAAVSGMIGRGGAAIKQLREATGCKISIAEPTTGGPDADQVITIVGPKRGIEQVLAEVVRVVHGAHAEAWFEGWASNPNTVFGQSRPPREDRRVGWGAEAAGGEYYQETSHRREPPASDRAAWRGGGAVVGGSNPNAVANLMSVASSLPSFVLDDTRGFALSCIVPNRLVGGLIGRGGSGTKEIQANTGTKIGIREIPGDPDNRSLNITGPLADACAAYMLMMKRYLEAEASEASAPAR
mmetsp:Transcript_47733/g.102295  ORF Transcript_47733/g.102295 Transcript_47733/m.102295 type:complete len:362 (+) Transcript_47733:79-1164(+)